MRRAAKRDVSESPIVKALELCGWTVQPLSQKDVPDLLLSRQGVTAVAEVKTGNEPLRPGQARWWARWQGEIVILRSVADALLFHQSHFRVEEKKGNYILDSLDSLE